MILALLIIALFLLAASVIVSQQQYIRWQRRQWNSCWRDLEETEAERVLADAIVQVQERRIGLLEALLPEATTDDAP